MISRVQKEQSGLSLSIDSLRDEVHVLRVVLDEIRDALEWQNKNAADLIMFGRESFPPRVEQPHDIQRDDEAQSPTATPPKQRSFIGR